MSFLTGHLVTLNLLKSVRKMKTMDIRQAASSLCYNSRADHPGVT